MVNIPRRLRRRLTLWFFIFKVFFILFFTILPPDASIRLAFYFNSARLVNAIRDATVDRDGWLRRQSKYPLDLRNDVGYLVKTGYGTRHRVPAQLEAFGKAGELLGEEGKGFLVVGDWTTVNETDARLLGVTVRDAVRMMMETRIDGERHNDERFIKYRSLQEQIEEGNENKANEIGSDFGWELDALKFIMGMEMIYHELPGKKWYIILDDDTFLVRSSLQLFLDRLDPGKPQYVGNAVGDYKGRFAHGGSAILISGAAMKQLFDRPDIVAAAYAESLDETWGDRLVATTFLKLGIRLDERYSHYFNGEPPSITRIRTDRFCSPLISFHGLRKPGEMVRVGRTLAHQEVPLLWSDVWELFGGKSMAELKARPTEQQHDYVGPIDEHVKTWDHVGTFSECRTRCEASGRWCMAWTYEVATNQCHGSPWMLLAADGAEGKASGVSWSKVEELLEQCTKYMTGLERYKERGGAQGAVNGF